ncbi:MAG TPA: hypothetical protein VKR54_05100 [Candidatus Babeliales bacterium]|jgi:hypothetical protein|nr:hypothetical protein [Candidatus Babeliales bacterium]
MIYKQKYTILLSGLFFFTNINCGQFNPAEHATQKMIESSIQTAFQVIAGQVGDELTYHRTKNRVPTPLEESQRRKLESEEELVKKNTEIVTAQEELLKIQKKDSEIDAFGKLIVAAQNMKNSDSNNPEYIKLTKRLELKLKELTKDLPELPTEEEPKKPEASTEDKDKQKKDSFMSSLLTYYSLTTAAAAAAADNLAYYSFKNITDLECFKDSFIDKHSTAINRALVAVTLTALAYKTYSLYKAYKAEKNAQDEDIFNDDLE